MNAAPAIPHRARRVAPAALLALVLGLLLAGCREVQEEAATTLQPAEVTQLEGQDAVQVRFSADAADRVDLQTVPVQRRGVHVVVPDVALIYDGQGVPWVYTSTGPLTFMRAKVVVDRVDGHQVLLSEGPPVGTEVVTVGATQVYGTELGIGESH